MPAIAVVELVAHRVVIDAYLAMNLRPQVKNLGFREERSVSNVHQSVPGAILILICFLLHGRKLVLDVKTNL